MEITLLFQLERTRRPDGWYRFAGLAEMLLPFLDQSIIPVRHNAKELRDFLRFPDIKDVSLAIHEGKGAYTRARNPNGKRQFAIHPSMELVVSELTKPQLVAFETELRNEERWGNYHLFLQSPEWDENVTSGGRAPYHERIDRVLNELWKFQDNPPIEFFLFVSRSVPCAIPDEMLGEEIPGEKTILFAAEETIQTIFGDFIPKANRLLSLAAVLHRASL
jgi:hypothetical protein